MSFTIYIKSIKKKLLLEVNVHKLISADHKSYLLYLFQIQYFIKDNNKIYIILYYFPKIGSNEFVPHTPYNR